VAYMWFETGNLDLESVYITMLPYALISKIRFLVLID
jgi:hypothetical protein